MVGHSTFVELSHEHVNNLSVTSVVSSGSQVLGVGSSAPLWCKQKKVGCSKETSEEEELVISYSAWQILLLVHLIVVNAEVQLIDVVCDESISVAGHV